MDLIADSSAQTPGCGRSYTNQNGLHYHVSSGGCRNGTSRVYRFFKVFASCLLLEHSLKNLLYFTVLGQEAMAESDSIQDRPGFYRLCEWKNCNRYDPYSTSLLVRCLPRCHACQGFIACSLIINACGLSPLHFQWLHQHSHAGTARR